jgi:HSP20 family protein
MRLTRWKPHREMLSLADAMNRLFEESFVRSPLWWREPRESNLSLPVDLVETDDNLVIRTDLPGLAPEDVEINITDHTLTIKGEFETEEEGERDNVHVRERRYGKFHRSVLLPTTVDTEAAEAEFEKGVLKIMLPKEEAAKPRRISVTAKS